MSVTAALKGSIILTDNLTGSISLSKIVNNSYTGTLSTYGQQVVVGTTTYTVNLPINPCQFVYVKNLSANTGTTVTVSWTPTGGSSVSIITLDPGATIVFSEVTSSFGISAMSMVSNQPGTQVEFILAG